MKTEDPIPFRSHIILLALLWPSMHPFLLQSSPTCAQTPYCPTQKTLWPWTWATAILPGWRLWTRDPHIPARRLQRPQGSGRVSKERRGQGSRSQEPQLCDGWRGRLGGGNAAEQSRRGQGRGPGLPAGGCPRRPSTCSSCTPLRGSASPQGPDPVLPHGPLLPPTPDQALASDAATGQPTRAGWLPTSGDRDSEPPTHAQRRQEPGPE